MPRLRTRAAMQRFALLTCALPLLASCQSTEPSANNSEISIQDKRKLQWFVRDFSEALMRNGQIANTELLEGSLDMLVTVNRQNQVIGCSTRPTQNAQLKMYPYNPRLARLIEPVCWNSVFPEVPVEMFGTESEQIIVAPLVFNTPDSVNRSRLQKMNDERYTTEQFFWKNLLVQQPLDAVGLAWFKATANAEGVVQTCSITLGPHPYRPLAFKLDNALLQRLGEQCKRLNLARLPGFKVDAEGVATVRSLIEYTPWRQSHEQRETDIQ